MNDKKTITPEELTISNMWQLEALYRLMIKKGLITEEEFINEFKLIKAEYDKENK
ncbi:MAG: hypothetical protein IAE93_12840 [Ignavibacteria bacterium]|nr:hypothetical protein [Ignavibacteria bacterium]